MNNKLNLILSFVIGVLFSVLFLWKVPGISSLIYFLVVVCFSLILVGSKNSKIKMNTVGFALLPFVLVIAVSSLFRADLGARVISLFALMFAQVLFLAVLFTPSSLTNFGVLTLITTPFKLAISWIPDAFNGFKEMLKKKSEKKRDNTQLKKVLLGVLISLPILFIVLGLLSAADAVFAKYFGDFLQNTLGAIFRDFGTFASFVFKAIVTLFVTLYYVGLNWGLANEESTLYKWLKQEKSEKEFKRNWDVTITSTIFVLLNIIFALFVFVQFKYLFGGQQNVLQVNSDLTYAQYARKGFWELLAVACLVYAIQFFINGKVLLASATSKMLFYINSALVSLFVLIITFSAERRLSLYEGSYGYTALRLFVHYSIFVIALLFVLLVLSNSLKNIKAFTTKLLAVVFSVTIFLLLVFPFDYASSLLNVNRYKDTKQIDYGYMFSLSNEALPNILELYRTAKTDFEKDMIRSELQARLYTLENTDKKWQEFNITNYAARNELKKELGDYKVTKGITDELNRFLNDYKETMIKGNYDEAYDKFWSKSTNKSSLAQDAKDKKLGIYQIKYEIPDGADNIETWKKNSVTANKLTLYVPYAAMYGYAGKTLTVNSGLYDSYYGEDLNSYASDRYRQLKVIIENNEIKIVSDYTFQLGENMTNYGTSYFRSNTFSK